MPPAAPEHLYTDETRVRTQLSAAGVRLALDDNRTKRVTADEQARLDQAVIDATETVNYYLASKYTPKRLAQSWWVWRRATVLAAYDLCTTRNNPPPESLLALAEQAQAELEAVQQGQGVVPGLPMRMTQAPTWSNVRIDQRRQFKVIRVERPTSSKSGLRQNPDYQAEYTPEW